MCTKTLTRSALRPASPEVSAASPLRAPWGTCRLPSISLHMGHMHSEGQPQCAQGLQWGGGSRAVAPGGWLQGAHGGKGVVV